MASFVIADLAILDTNVKQVRLNNGVYPLGTTSKFATTTAMRSAVSLHN